ncbi:MAG TPA: aldehyde dehydrogenase family protein [Opitutaceae bacterium]|nr:aldehyde dehydrogenase family protein [Opitutaceae bacterium]
MPFVSVNPATGRRLRSWPAHRPAEVERRVTKAAAAARQWREASLPRRAAHLRAIARALRARSRALADLIVAEMGKPLGQARAEIEKCALTCEFYAKHGPRFLSPQRPEGAPPNAEVRFEPLGTVLAVMPWNFPVWQALRAATPAIMAGNAFLLKHAPNVTGCALAVESLLAAAARDRRGPAPAGLLQALLVEPPAVARLLADPRVHAVTLTGSTRAGRSVAAAAGAAMKKGVFELGGSDAYVVLEDADLDRAAEICAGSRLINSGQSCVCAKRFIVVEKVRREFEGKFAARLAARRMGDPRDPATDVGPLARRDLREHLDAQVRASVRAGARLVFGGRPAPGPGWFYPPTLLTGVRPGMPAYAEELFGPVAAVIAARDEAHALALANDSAYGLGAAVFTRSRRRGEAAAARLDAGVVCINDFVRSDAALPFGGVKQSGHGRELGAFGLREFVNIKTVWTG